MAEGLVAEGLLTAQLNDVDPDRMVIIRPEGSDYHEAAALAASGPSNQEVLDACKAAYRQHTNAVDQTTFGSVKVSQDSGQRQNIQALHAYNWDSKVAPPGMAQPIFASAAMAAARAAVERDKALATFFLGIQANIDLFIGAEGGVGVGFAIPSKPNDPPIWMAYGGYRLAFNIDVGININASLFLEPPKEVAGDFLGIEFSGRPVAEGPEVSFGIHMTPDLKKLRGFTLGVGVGLSVLPVTVAIVRGKIVTSA